MENSGVANDERGDVGLVGLAVALVGAVAPHEPAAHDDERNDNSHHSDGISDGTTERSGRAGSRVAELLERLLRRTECGRIGGSPAEYPHHIGQGHPSRPYGRQGYERTESHYAQPQQIEFAPPLPEGTYKAGADLQTQYIDKKDETETFGVGQHLGIEPKA